MSYVIRARRSLNSKARRASSYIYSDPISQDKDTEVVNSPAIAAATTA